MANNDQQFAARTSQRGPHRRGTPNGPTASQGPEQPTRLGRQSWLAVFKRTFKQVGDDKLTTWAAALTYYSILSIFPALLVLIAALRLTGKANMQKVLHNITEIAPGPARSILRFKRC